MEIIFAEIDEIVCPCCGSKIDKGDICFGCGYNNIPNIWNKEHSQTKETITTCLE